MSIGFAGSKSLDDRRRRRLAQESDAVVDAGSSTPTLSEEESLAAAEAADSRGASPADSLISPRLWKHVVISLTGFLVWGGLLALGDAADQAQDGFESIVGLKAGKLAAFFSTVCLLAAGQLAFITLWYRSRSRKDFSGSYKVWFWTAVCWLTLCAFRATGTHWNLADGILAGRPIAIWNGRLLAWMIPAAIPVFAIYRLLLREVRDCGASLWLLRCSTLALAAAGLSLLAADFTTATRWMTIVQTGSATLWHLLLALAGLFHARHVVHFTKEPPTSPILPWAVTRLWNRIVERLARSTGSSSPGNDDSADESDSEAAEEGSGKNRKRKKTRSRTQGAAVERSEELRADQTDADADGVVAKLPTNTSRGATETVAAVRPAPQAEIAAKSSTINPPSPAVDSRRPPLSPPKPHIQMRNSALDPLADADDELAADDEESADDAHAGLSKKERKRLQKAERRQQRTRV
jgi:hypothetical protein